VEKLWTPASVKTLSILNPQVIFRSQHDMLLPMPKSQNLKSAFIIMFIISAVPVFAAPPLPAKSEAKKAGAENVIEASKNIPLTSTVGGGDSSNSDSTPSSESTSLIPSSSNLSSQNVSPAKLESSPLKVSAESASEDQEISQWKLHQSRPHLTVGIGYTHSEWRKIGANLRNGSMAWDIGFEREWSPAFEAGLHVSAIGISSDTNAFENVYAVGISINSRYLLMPGKMRPFVGLGIGVSSFRVWSLSSETANSISYTKHIDGSVFGVYPELGLRFDLSEHNFFDLSAGYTGYLDHPKSRMGGANVLFRFGFRR